MAHTCRFCGAPLSDLFVSLGAQPPSNSFLTADALGRPEPTYPLDVYVCRDCLLVQLPVHRGAEEIFDDYVYFSSFSDGWLRHCEAYAKRMCRELALGPASKVVEIASNDGYLLQYFKAAGVPVLGVEPSHTVADAARAKGIEVVQDFFGRAVAARLRADGVAPDLIVGNNVLAHVPDLNDFVAGLAALLPVGGLITMEFPHVVRLVEGMQFDTIYHEHFSYFSLITVRAVFAKHGLAVFDVEELPTHGGSLRIHARHPEDARCVETARIGALLAAEKAGGYAAPAGYAAFKRGPEKVREELLAFLKAASADGKLVAGYGAPAKGNTLLNYCGIGTDLLPFTVDRSPHKQGLFLPGSHIPVLAPEEIRRRRPDYLLILPWNLTDEIVAANADIRDWGGRFVVAVPKLEVLA